MFNFYRVAILCFCLGNFFVLSLSASEVTRDDERWHDLGNKKLYPATASNSYEWFYFDVQQQDGTQLAVSFLGPNTFDVSMQDILSGAGTSGHVGVVAQAYVPGVGQLQCFDSVLDPAQLVYKENKDASAWQLSIEGSQVSMQEAGKGKRNYSMDLNMNCQLGATVVGAVTGHLYFEGELPGWKHNDGILFSTSGGALYGSWIVPVPRAKVSGHYKFSMLNQNGGTDSTEVKIQHATGYHDHNRGNVPMSVGNEGWVWGRAVTKNGKTVVYAHLNGKSQPDFPGDQFVPTGPSNIVYLNDGGREVLDSDQVDFQIVGNEYDFTDANFGIDMMIPLQYKFTDPKSGLVVEAVMPKTASTTMPFYIRQESRLSVSDCHGKVDSGDLINEQIEFKLFFKYLGFPVFQ